MKINQLKAGAVLAYISIILTIVIGIVITPYMLKKLGPSEYGLYTLIGGFVGYLTLLDFGINNAIIRFVAKHRAVKDRKAEEQFLGTSLIMYGFISLILILIGTILYLNIDKIFINSLTTQELRKAKIMFIILIFNLAITLPGNIFAAISTGYEKFVFPRLANIIKYLLRSIALISILYLGAGAIEIVILDTIMNLLLISTNAYYVLRILKVHIELKKIRFHSFKKIFQYAFWIFLFSVVQQFQWSFGQGILGIYTNTKIVAIYAIGVMLGTYYGSFARAVSGVFLPRATKMIVKKSSDTELTDMMIRIGRISFIIQLYILIAFIFFGKQFIKLWIGNEYIQSWKIAVLIMLSYTIYLVQNFGNTILEAKNMVKFKSLLFLISLIIGVSIGVFIIKKYGMMSFVICMTITWLVAQIIMNIYFSKVIHLEIIRFFKELFHKIIIGIILILIFAYIISLMPGENWSVFFLKSTLYSILFFIIFYKLGMNQYERKLLLQLKNR